MGQTPPPHANTNNKTHEREKQRTLPYGGEHPTPIKILLFDLTYGCCGSLEDRQVQPGRCNLNFIVTNSLLASFTGGLATGEGIEPPSHPSDLFRYRTDVALPLSYPASKGWVGIPISKHFGIYTHSASDHATVILLYGNGLADPATSPLLHRKTHRSQHQTCSISFP